MNPKEQSRQEYTARINRVMDYIYAHIQQAWNSMYMWFTGSGYQQGDGCTYELYHNDSRLHPEKKHIVDICIPVKPLLQREYDKS